MPRILLTVFAALALLAASCGDDDDSTAPTTDPGTSTSAAPDDSSPDNSTSTTEPEPTAAWERCDNPEGFSISYPESWHVNDGSVTEACSQFDPETFEVPEATDERVAAITAHVEDVPFHEVASPGDEDRRAVTTVDGHQAVRTVGPAGELYGEDTEITTYAIDLALGVDDGDGTLILDVVDLEGVAYDDAVSVLDRMVRTIELATDDIAENTVARYEGAAPFSGELTVQDGEPCLTTPTQGEPTTECFTPPSPDGLRFADFSGELFSAIGGVVGSDVFRVHVSTDSGGFTYLPVGTDESEARGWVMPIGPDGVQTIEWFDLEGDEVGARHLDEDD